MSEIIYYPVVQFSEIAPGERVVFDLADMGVVLFRVGDDFYAVADLCTHDDGPISEGEVIGDEIVCPRHGARFSLKDGSATRFPAVQKINWYPVRVKDGMVEVGYPPI